MTVEAVGAIFLPRLHFWFGEGVREVLGFIVEEEFGEAFVGEVGVKVSELVFGHGFYRGEADAVLVVEEAVVKSGFGVVGSLVVFVGEMLIFEPC